MNRSILAALGAALLLSPGVAVALEEFHGFVETAWGIRTTEVPAAPSDYVLDETRGQLRLNAFGEQGEAFLRLDFLHDRVQGGAAELEMREGFLRFTTLGDHLDVKAGRQALTWGTGDLIFINDLFPKDWVSFFAGREDQYLKAPSDAVRLGIFGLPVDLDVVVASGFTPDRMPDGTRLVFASPVAGGVPTLPNAALGNAEIAARASRYVGDFTAALYTYHGFFPTPACVSPGGSVPTLTYPALSAHGASLRGPLGPGIAWAETGLYDSRDDRDGTDPFVPNSSARWLAGYEVPLSTDFNLTLQYYGERQLDYDAYLAHLDGAVPDDEDYTLLTARAEKWLRYQTVRLSLFAFHSPTVEETHIRALASVKLSDEIEAALGAGLFAGDYARGRFSRFDDNDHVFLRFRYGF